MLRDMVETHSYGRKQIEFLSQSKLKVTKKKKKKDRLAVTPETITRLVKFEYVNFSYSIVIIDFASPISVAWIRSQIHDHVRQKERGG